MARDIFHQNVKEALIKDGWTITHDPYELEIGSPDYEIDLGAEKIIAAQRGVDIIAVEVKSFISRSVGYEFHQAVGQYRNYKSALNDLDPNRLIFWLFQKRFTNLFSNYHFPKNVSKKTKFSCLFFHLMTTVS